jgi:hypothetical protein
MSLSSRAREWITSPEAGSLSNRMRDRRTSRFLKLVEPLPRPVRILDVGGTTRYWEQRGLAGDDRFEITTLNLEAEEPRAANITPLAGDATDLSDHAGSFDVAFSNSVIEHLGTFDRQRQMAEQMRTAAPAMWVQTPNHWFLIEPHFYFPGWQWLPRHLRYALIQRYRLGWQGPYSDPVKARTRVDDVRLMTRAELRMLFPGAEIAAERFAGLNKSWIVYSGFPAR